MMSDVQALSGFVIENFAGKYAITNSSNTKVKVSISVVSNTNWQEGKNDLKSDRASDAPRAHAAASGDFFICADRMRKLAIASSRS